MLVVFPERREYTAGGGLFGKREGGRVHKELFRRRRDHEAPWERGLFGWRKRGESTKMNKRACPAPVSYKVTQLQMAQVWVT